MNNKLLGFLKTYPYPLAYGIGTPVLCAMLIWVARTWPNLGQLYAVHLFPILPNGVGRFFSLFPFSVLEMGLYLLALLVIFGGGLLLSALAIHVIQLHGKGDFLIRFPAGSILKAVPHMLVVLLCFCSTLFLMITLACSLNYSRDGIARDVGILPAPASHQDLVQLSQLLIGDIQQLQPLAWTEEGKDSTVFLRRETKLAMDKLGQKYPSLSGYYPNPKPVLMSSWMSRINLTGLFSPYTIEANYNDDVPSYIKPYTICHELAHLKGYIREDDAGFIAYLACSESSSPQLRYSGAMNALSFVLSTLYEDSSQEEYRQILRQLPESALADLAANQQYWLSYQGRASRISSAANDRYLKANAQESGVQSYGQMVDLLLAYYGLNSQSV